MWFVSYVHAQWARGVRAPCFFRTSQIMKKNKQTKGFAKKKTEQQKVEEPRDDKNLNIEALDDEDQGFGGWLRSADGMETMKLFVIANSIVMVTTLAYPHVQTVFEILSEMIYGSETLY